MSNKESHATSKKLGCQLIADGRYEEAEPIFRVLVECRLEVFGNANEETASAYQMLAFVLEKQGKYEEALRKYDQALKAYEEAYEGQGHPDADFIYASMVKVYRITKQFDEALEKAKRLLEIRLKDLGDAHPKTALSYHSLGICLYDQGKHKEALGTMNKALQVHQCAGDDDTHGIAAIYTTMAKILVEQDRFDKAMLIYKRVLTHQVKVLGHHSPAVALTYRNMALAHQSQSNSVEAWKACVKALQIQSKLMEDKDPNAAWRKQCQNDSGSPSVLRTEAKKTLQITQVLEKQMAAATFPTQPPTATDAAPTNEATATATIEQKTTDVTQKRKVPHGLPQMEGSTVTKKRRLAKSFPSVEALEENKGRSNPTQEPITKMNAKPQRMNQLEPQPTVKVTAAALLTTEATTTATSIAPTNEAATRTTHARNYCDLSYTNFTQKRKLKRKLREIEAFEERGLFNLTEEEITKLKSKQEILVSLAALEDLASPGVKLPTEANAKIALPGPEKQMVIIKLPSQETTAAGLTTASNHTDSSVRQTRKEAKKLRPGESLEEEKPMEVDKENQTRPSAAATESEGQFRSKSASRRLRRKLMKQQIEARKLSDGTESDQTAIAKVPSRETMSGTFAPLDEATTTSQQTMSATTVPTSEATTSISLKRIPHCPSRELAFSSRREFAGCSTRYSPSLTFRDRLGSMRGVEGTCCENSRYRTMSERNSVR